MYILSLSNWIEHVSSDTNRIDSFCSSSEVKNLPFSHLMALRYRRYTTYGIRAQVTTLGPKWAECKLQGTVGSLSMEGIEIKKSNKVNNDLVT